MTCTKAISAKTLHGWIGSDLLQSPGQSVSSNLIQIPPEYNKTVSQSQKILQGYPEVN